MSQGLAARHIGSLLRALHVSSHPGISSRCHDVRLRQRLSRTLDRAGTRPSDDLTQVPSHNASVRLFIVSQIQRDQIWSWVRFVHRSSRVGSKIFTFSGRVAVMLNEAKTSRPKPRPELRGRCQFLEVEAKAEAKNNYEISTK